MPRPPEIPRTLPALFALYHALWRIYPDDLRVALRLGLPGGTEDLPALAMGFGARAEVLLAWCPRALREREVSALLHRSAAEGLSEVFLFDPSAESPAPGLLGYALDGPTGRAIENRDGLLESRVLGLQLRAEGARVRAVSQGEPVPFPDELEAQLRRAQADATRWKGRAERAEAELERVRAELIRQKARTEHWKGEARRGG